MKYDGQDCKLVQLKFIEFYGDFGKKKKHWHECFSPGFELKKF